MWRWKGFWAYPVSSKDSDYNEMSQILTKWFLDAKGAKKGKEKVTRKESSKVWWYRVERCTFLFVIFFIPFLFWYSFHVVWCSPGIVGSDKMLGGFFVLKMTADYNRLRDFLQCMCLIRVAWKKSNVCLSSIMWEKRAFPSSFILIDHLCLSILFYIVLGSPDVMFVVIFAWDRVYACVRSVFVVGLFWDVGEIFNGLWRGLNDWYF